jgi:hypothetical protein
MKEKTVRARQYFECAKLMTYCSAGGVSIAVTRQADLPLSALLPIIALTWGEAAIVSLQVTRLDANEIFKSELKKMTRMAADSFAVPLMNKNEQKVFMEKYLQELRERANSKVE